MSRSYTDNTITEVKVRTQTYQCHPCRSDWGDCEIVYLILELHSSSLHDGKTVRSGAGTPQVTWQLSGVV